MRKNYQNELNEPHDISLLFQFILISRINNLNINLEEVKHSFHIHSDKVTILDILNICKAYSIKSKYSHIKDINKLRLPALIKFKDGSWKVILSSNQDDLLVLDHYNGNPRKMPLSDFYQEWDAKVLLFIPDKKLESSYGFGISWFFQTMLKYKRILIEVLIVSFTIQLLGLVSPLITQVVIDKALNNKVLSTLDILTIGLFVIIVFETVLSITRNYVLSHTSNKLDVTLGAKLFHHLLSLPLRYFENSRIGDTVARVRMLENIRQFLTGTPLTAILDLSFVVIYIGVMFLYSTKLTFIVLLSFPIYILFSIIVTPMLRKRLDEKFYTGAESQSFLVESVTGIQTVKANALEPVIQKRWENNLASYASSNFKANLLSSNSSNIAKAVQKIFDLLILWYGARLAIDGNISVGQLIAFRMLAGRVSEPILRVVQIWHDFQQVKISIERVGDILNTKMERKNVNLKNLPKIKGKISIKNVAFRYSQNDEPVIKNFNLDIEQGKVVGFVGRSGSGKSTLSKLIQRLYIPERGKIFIDDIDISLVDPHWLRRQIGVVLQESFLFTGTVFENIAIHNPMASLEDVIRVAKISGAHDFIAEFPEGYETMVGENGSTLSGGQKQRIAIARALLSNPRILIFDEATSALDYESERIIQRNMKEITRGRTVLMIAHRLSTLKDADEIVVIDKGEIMENGAPDRLLSQNGFYKYLYDQQFGGDSHEARREIKI